MVILVLNTRPLIHIGVATTILGNSNRTRCVALAEVVAQANMHPILLLARTGVLVLPLWVLRFLAGYYSMQRTKTQLPMSSTS